MNQIQKECKLEIDVEEYAESFKPYLMDVIYNWSKVDVSLAILNFCFSTSNAGEECHVLSVNLSVFDTCKSQCIWSQSVSPQPFYSLDFNVSFPVDKK